MALTVSVDVPPRDREVLESWLRAPSVRAGLAQRARIVLLAAESCQVHLRQTAHAERNDQ